MNRSESLAESYEMTLPKADNEVLINLASSSLTSIELVFFTLSEPAKSIKERVECIYSFNDIFFAKYIVRMV